MMTKNEILEKVNNYLEKENIIPIKDSLKYMGIRENVKQIDGREISIHAIGYQVQIDEQNPYSIVDNFIDIDVKTNKLLSITTPHLYKKIDDE